MRRVGAPSKDSMAARIPLKRRRTAPALELGPDFGFPFRQEVRVPAGARPLAESTARAVLGEVGFELVALPTETTASGGGPPGLGSVWVGERGLRRRGVTSSAAVVPIIAVFVAGSILGGLDAYIVGSPLVGIFWVLGAAGASAIFWWRYGGTYDSDLVLVTISEARSNSPPGTSSLTVVFWAARVRSQVQSDLRLPSVISGPLKLAAELGGLVRRFRQQMGLPAPVGRRSTDPA